eukprot:gb/GEZN01000304.1/.p1 GENE.gb/GEZN01000304.1/~~gb/GEZN01000304.1/.p1  ORF type:complete len:1491 (-),score=201.61 gb/GEZN01000304.1/:251-4723(-)
MGIDVNPYNLPGAFQTYTNKYTLYKNYNNIYYVNYVCTTNVTSLATCPCTDAANIGLCRYLESGESLYQCPSDPNEWVSFHTKQNKQQGTYLTSIRSSSTLDYVGTRTIGDADILNVSDLKVGCKCTSGTAFRGRVCQVQQEPYYSELEPSIQANSYQYTAPCAAPFFEAYFDDPDLMAAYLDSAWATSNRDRSKYYFLHGEHMVGLNCDIPAGQAVLVLDTENYRTEKAWDGTVEPYQYNFPGLLSQEIQAVTGVEDCRIQVRLKTFDAGWVLHKGLNDFYLEVLIAARCEHHPGGAFPSPSTQSVFSSLESYVNNKTAVYGPLEVLSRVRGFLEYRARTSFTSDGLEEVMSFKTTGTHNAPDNCIALGCAGAASVCNTETGGCECADGTSGLNCHYTPNQLKTEYFNLVTVGGISRFDANPYHAWIQMSKTNSNITFHLRAEIQGIKGHFLKRNVRAHVVISFLPWQAGRYPENFLMYQKVGDLYKVSFNMSKTMPGVFVSHAPVERRLNNAQYGDLYEASLTMGKSGIFQYEDGSKESNRNLSFAVLFTGEYSVHEMLTGRLWEWYENHKLDLDDDKKKSLNVDPSTQTEYLNYFGPVSTGAYVNWRSDGINKPTFVVSVTVQLDDSVARVVDLVALGAFIGTMFFLMILVCRGRCKNGSIPKYLQEAFRPTDIRRRVRTEKEQELRKQRRMANKKEEFKMLEMHGFDIFDMDRDKKLSQKRACSFSCSFSMLGLLFFVASIVIRLIMELIKLAFNISILHTSLKASIKLPDVTALQAQVAEFFSFLGFQWVSKYFEWLMNLFSTLDFLKSMGEGWNCGGAVALAAPVFVVIGCYLFFRILHDDALLKLAITTRGDTVGRSLIRVQLNYAGATLLSSVTLYLLQTVVLLLTSVVMTTVSHGQRSCSDLDRIMVTIARFLAYAFSVLALYIAVLLFGGPSSFTFRGLTLGWLVGLKAVTVMTLGIWNEDNIKRFRIVERAEVYDNDETDRDNCQEAVMGLMGRSRALMWLPIPVAGIFIAKIGEAANEAPGLVCYRGKGTLDGVVSLLTPAWKRVLLYFLSIMRLIATIYFTVEGSVKALEYMFVMLVVLVMVRVLPCYNYAKPKSSRKEEEKIVIAELWKEMLEHEKENQEAMHCVSCNAKFGVPPLQPATAHAPAGPMRFRCPLCEAVNERPISIYAKYSNEAKQESETSPSDGRPLLSPSSSNLGVFDDLDPSRPASRSSSLSNATAATVHTHKPNQNGMTCVNCDKMFAIPSGLMQFACPMCHAPNNRPGFDPTKAMSCVSCAKMFSIPALQPATASSPSGPMLFSCPICHTTNHRPGFDPGATPKSAQSASSKSAQNGMSCVSCKKMFAVPALQPATASSPAGPMQFACPMCHTTNNRAGYESPQNVSTVTPVVAVLAAPVVAAAAGAVPSVTLPEVTSQASYGGQAVGYGGQHAVDAQASSDLAIEVNQASSDPPADVDLPQPSPHPDIEGTLFSNSELFVI